MLTLRKNKGNKLTHDEMDANFEYAANPSGKKVYKALLSQSGTDAPVATVLENTLGGEVVWSRVGIGLYDCVGINLFPINKTLKQLTLGYTWEMDSAAAWYSNNTNDGFTIATMQDDLTAFSDNVLENASINIEVYP